MEDFVTEVTLTGKREKGGATLDKIDTRKAINADRYGEKAPGDARPPRAGKTNDTQVLTERVIYLIRKGDQ